MVSLTRFLSFNSKPKSVRLHWCSSRENLFENWIRLQNCSRLSWGHRFTEKTRSQCGSTETLAYLFAQFLKFKKEKSTVASWTPEQNSIEATWILFSITIRASNISLRLQNWLDETGSKSKQLRNELGSELSWWEAAQRRIYVLMIWNGPRFFVELYRSQQFNVNRFLTGPSEPVRTPHSRSIEIEIGKSPLKYCWAGHTTSLRQNWFQHEKTETMPFFLTLCIGKMVWTVFDTILTAQPSKPLAHHQRSAQQVSEMTCSTQSNTC